MLLICAHNFFSHDLWLIFPSSTCLFVWGLWVCHHLVLGSNAYPQQWTVKNYLPYLMKAFPSFTLPPLYLLQIMLMHIHNLDFLNPETCSIPVSGYGFQNVWHHVPIQPWATWFPADSILGLVMYACFVFGLFSKSFLIIQEFGVSAEQALGWLMSVPRASGTILEATVPYSRASMVQLLGKVGFYGDPQDVLKMTFDMCIEFLLQSIIKSCEWDFPW